MLLALGGFFETFELIGYASSSLIMACQTDPLWLNFWRLMTAIGLGIEVIAIDAYLSELVPPALRGRAFAINRIMSYLAVPACGITSFIFVPYEPLGVNGWRWMIAIGAVGSIVVWIMRRKLPESPRWLTKAAWQRWTRRPIEDFSQQCPGIGEDLWANQAPGASSLRRAIGPA